MNYYIFNYFIPSGLFVMISWVSFVIPPDSVPGRVALLITTLLVLVNIANTVFSVSPAADAINALQQWVFICISFVFVTVVEYGFVLCLLRYLMRVISECNGLIRCDKESKAAAVQGADHAQGVHLDAPGAEGVAPHLARGPAAGN